MNEKIRRNFFYKSERVKIIQRNDDVCIAFEGMDDKMARVEGRCRVTDFFVRLQL